MGPMGGGVQNQPAPPYRQSAGKPGAVGVTGVGTANVSLQQNQQFQQVYSHDDIIIRYVAEARYL